MRSRCAQSQATLEVYSYTSKVSRTLLKKPQILVCTAYSVYSFYKKLKDLFLGFNLLKNKQRNYFLLFWSDLTMLYVFPCLSTYLSLYMALLSKSFKQYLGRLLSLIKCPLRHGNTKNETDRKIYLLKVSKSQKHFFLKLHCPKNKQNIGQNSALEFKKWLNKTIKGHF